MVGGVVIERQNEKSVEQTGSEVRRRDRTIVAIDMNDRMCTEFPVHVPVALNRFNRKLYSVSLPSAGGKTVHFHSDLRIIL